MSAASLQAHLEQAQRALARGRAREAEALCAQLVEENPKSAAAWHLLGLARHRLGQHAEAAQALLKATNLQRDVAKYHHDLGVALADDGKLDRAITSFRRALRLDDRHAEVHNDLGTAYFQKGWYAEAEACFRKAIELRPDHGIAHANLGEALRKIGRLQEGRREFQRALMLRLRALLPRFLQWRIGGTPTAENAAPTASQEVPQLLDALSRLLLADKLQEARVAAEQGEARFPDHPDVLYLAAMVREKHNEPAAALQRVEAAIALKPERGEYHVSRSRLLVTLGRDTEALQAAERATVLDPGSAEAYCALSTAQRSAQRPDLAEAAARTAIELDAQSHEGHSNLSAALWAMGKLDDAEGHAREALRLYPKGPHYALNLAVILKDAGKIDEAGQIYHAQVANPPEQAGSLLNLGTLALVCAGDLEAARRWYRRSQALGDTTRALLSEAIIDLLESRFDVAWPKYEARKQVAGHRERHAPFAGFPAWNGETLTGERLLVYGEQGLGDEIMFASMIPELQRRAPQLAFMCDARLASLFARSFPGTDVLPLEINTLPRFAFAPERVVALCSLGLHFRRAASDFPTHSGYLVPDPAKVAAWRERLAAAGPGRKIGFSWMGGAFNTSRATRSLRLEQLRPLLESPDTVAVSLQYGDCAAEIAAFTQSTGIALHADPDVTRDMDDLASLIEALDLVVSVCNATVHVAGAINKQVLVMAPFLPEWRYGRSGERMLWYPAARVFRQAARGDWSSVISAVKAQLQA